MSSHPGAGAGPRWGASASGTWPACSPLGALRLSPSVPVCPRLRPSSPRHARPRWGGRQTVLTFVQARVDAPTSCKGLKNRRCPSQHVNNGNICFCVTGQDAINTCEKIQRTTYPISKQNCNKEIEILKNGNQPRHGWLLSLCSFIWGVKAIFDRKKQKKTQQRFKRRKTF